MLIRKELPLDAEDISKLRKNLLPMFIFPLFIVGLFYCIYTFIFNNEGSFGPDSSFQIIFMLFGVFFLGIIVYMIWSHAADIKNGIKESVEGTVTDKRLNIKTSTSQTSGGARGTTRTTTKTSRHYYMYLEGEEFKVNYQHYSKVRTGDRILMERTPKAGFILNLGVISQSDEATRQESDQVDQKFLSTAVQEVSLTPEDLTFMERQFKSTLRSKVLKMLPLTLVCIWFIASGIGGLLLFIFPVVVIPVVQLIGIIRFILRYRKSKSEGVKTGITAMVLDKITVTGNRTNTRHGLLTTWGKLTVSTALYDQLDRDEKIVLYKPTHSKEPISLLTLKGEEFYLE